MGTRQGHFDVIVIVTKADGFGGQVKSHFIGKVLATVNPKIQGMYICERAEGVGSADNNRKHISTEGVSDLTNFVSQKMLDKYQYNQGWYSCPVWEEV